MQPISRCALLQPYVHADEAGGAGENSTDQEAKGSQPAKLGNKANKKEENDTDHGDGLVLSAEIGLCTLLDCLGNLFHAVVAGGQREDLLTGNPAIQHCQNGAP